ncbi:plastocyanin/azurin family copper-binding protein [Haloferula chungangensis]|uniref:Plastocyanin/azurin family copper-binding protein n=1 Tax=Haloferula chungangensis TaxID=1048331 RepID=A0ABW2L794_9BACT
MVSISRLIFALTFLLTGATLQSAEKPTRKKTAVNSAETASTNGMPNVSVKADGLTIFYGNSFVERQQEDGTLESLLQVANAGEQQRFRSMAYTGDEVGFRIRAEKFGDHMGYISKQLPCERVVMCFGMNESFAGAEGLAKFAKDLDLYLSIIEQRHPASELVLVSPTAVEKVASGDFPDPVARNADIELYCKVMQETAEKRGVRFIDLFGPSKKLFAESKASLTSNGMHLNDAGNRELAKVLAAALSSAEKVSRIETESPGFLALRKLVSRKAYEVAMAYHPANGIHYYGVRRRDYEYASEIPHHLVLANQLDEAIWKQAADLKSVQSFPELEVVEATPPASTPRKGLGVIQSTEEDLAGFSVADGFDVNLFASSEEFPELVNPLQLNFDAQGRLWVICFASYPVPLPGQLSDDKVLIFEDTDGDGKADKRTVFADKLKLPDGFVFYKDGIIVSVARQFLWLRDTDGDDVADVREEILRGADDTDTHHGGYLERTPQGQLIVNEALFHRGQFETPQGVVRTKDAATLFYDLDSQTLTVERQTTHPNPWKVSFNPWGESIQMFGGGQIIDCDFYNVATPVGTSSLPTMGMPFRDDKGCTLEFVSSPHFPQEWSGGLLTGHLLAKNAVLYTPLKLEGGTWVKAGESINLLSSENKVFRPTDLGFGLDGALYVSDFYYPIIGHAQHSIRDANRDYSHGRIWRVTRKGSALATPPKIAGAELNELFDLLTHPQVRVQELAREELERRPSGEVLAHAKSRIAEGMSDGKLGLELLWLFEREKDFSQPELLRELVSSRELPIQRAAARSLRWWAPSLGDEAKLLASDLMKSPDERTRMAVISVASHLLSRDPFWMKLVDDASAPDGTPLDRVVKLAQLHGRMPLSPEFPILTVSPESKLVGWLRKEKDGGASLYFQSDEARDLILSYAGDPHLNITFNGIPVRRSRGDVHSKSGQLTVNLIEGMNVIETTTRLGGRRMGKATLHLATLVGQKPEGIHFAKDADEHQHWAKVYDEKYATVTDGHIYLKTIPAALEFNVKSFTVKAGKTYEFIFENVDHMLHNVVITKPGTEAEVGAMADAMAAQADAMARHYVPETDLILFSTPQVPDGETVKMEFTTPQEPGNYPYICTFPGHWRIMRGVMIVEAQ